MMRKSVGGLAVILALLLASTWAGGSEECTTAVITGRATSDGRPILWKNRDTDKLSNKVVYVREKPYSYLAVVDAQYPSGRVAWGGLNEAGLAIINSVAYNLPQRQGESQDLEGLVMADALRSCATVADFESYLKRNVGPDLGSRTNFCLIDAEGGASIFEVHNHGYQVLDANAAAEQCLLNTNFSRSGSPDEGAGYLRFDREQELFKTVAGKLSVQFIIQTAARDVGHALVSHVPRSEWKDLPADRPYWVHANYTINRASTASVIAAHGVNKGDDPAHATLWVILGEPLCSLAVPLWVVAGETPSELREGADAPIAREALRIKNLLRPLKGRDRREYIDVTKLDNRTGTGWLPGNLKVEQEIFEKTRHFLAQYPNSGQMSAFEKRMAQRALQRLQEIR